MKSQRTQLIIPSEVHSREFDGKLLLACVAAKRGFSSVVGSRNDIHMMISRLPRSIYVGKDVRHSSDRISAILKRLGHTIVALDEEAQFYYSREHYRKARVSRPAFRAATALMAWGPDNAEAWRESPHYQGTPIHITGNPRVDMMRPELRAFFDAEVADLRRRYGGFILVNTNFGSLNHFYPNLSPLKPPEHNGMKPSDDFESGLARHRYPIFRAFLGMVPLLARHYPDRAIVVRPHPAENHETWQRAAGGAANVKVLHEGNVIPWLLAAEAMIHNGCNTGLEAYTLGARPIAFRPLISERFDLDLPNDLCHQATSVDDLLVAIDSMVEGRYTVDPETARTRRALFEQHIAGFEGPFAAERMMDVVEGVERVHRAAPKPGFGAHLLGLLSARRRTLQKWRNAGRPGHKSNIAYTRHRFPDIEGPAVQKRIDAFNEILGRFAGVRAVEIDSNIFQILPVEGSSPPI